MSASDKDNRDVREIAEENPAVDPNEVEEAQRILQELRRLGTRRRGYEISSPYVRRPMRKVLGPGTDTSG